MFITRDYNGFNLWSDVEDRFRHLQHEMNRISDKFTSHSPKKFPKVNAWAEGEDELVFTAELPGVNSDDVEITVTGNHLTLSGSREGENGKDGESYHRRERWNGEFSRSFNLPFNVDSDKVNAKFSKGVLYITLPKAESEKPKKISLN